VAHLAEGAFDRGQRLFMLGRHDLHPLSYALETERICKKHFGFAQELLRTRKFQTAISNYRRYLPRPKNPNFCRVPLCNFTLTKRAEMYSISTIDLLNESRIKFYPEVKI
jgi:hypothetical protein